MKQEENKSKRKAIYNILFCVRGSKHDSVMGQGTKAMEQEKQVPKATWRL